MKCAELIEPESIAAKDQNVIQMPFGLFGFEGIKRYTLLTSPDEAPFMWFQMLEDPSLSFLVVSPYVVIPNYQPDICADDAEFLELGSPEDALVFNIVTLREGAQASVNLKGPIIVNRHTRIGKQIVPINAIEFALQHPLIAAD